jgi:hypothetical protein
MVAHADACQAHVPPTLSGSLTLEAESGID